jgi:hypothetical protein
MGKKKSGRQRAAEANALAAEQRAQAAQTLATNLRNNQAANLSSNNAPTVATPEVGVDESVVGVAGSTKRRRASGALSSQLGVNV